MKAAILSARYGIGTDVEHELRVLKYAAVRHMQEATMRKWQAATVGCYHARRCIKIAMSVWVGDTPVLSTRYKDLAQKMTRNKDVAVKAVFFSSWKQPVNVRILAERRCFARAQRSTRQVGVARFPLKVSRIHVCLASVDFSSSIVALI